MLCQTCGDEKSIIEFHKRNGKPFPDCKLCYNIDRLGYVPKNRDIVSNQWEALVINKLRDLKIYAAPGKCSEWKWVDVIAWGCVKIEVKFSNLNIRGRYEFNFSKKQQANGLDSDLIILVTESEPGEISFYLFQSDEPRFYDQSGRLKQVSHYYPNPKKHQDPKRFFTNAIMEISKDCWWMIDQIREEKVQHGFPPMTNERNLEKQKNS